MWRPDDRGERRARVRLVFVGDPLPSDQRTTLVPIAGEGSTDEDLLEDASNNIEEYLHAQGTGTPWRRMPGPRRAANCT